MAIIISRITNNLNYSFTMPGPNFNNNQNANLIIPANAVDLDLLTLTTEDGLWAIQQQFIALVNTGSITVTGTIDTATFEYDGVGSIHTDSNPDIRGNIHLISGTNITLAQFGQNITINSTGGGGGSPAAPVNSVQFNNAGSFGGSSNFTFVDQLGLSTLSLGDGNTQTAWIVGSLQTVLKSRDGDAQLVMDGDSPPNSGNSQIQMYGADTLIEANTLLTLQADIGNVVINTPTGGLLPPLLTTVQRDAIVSPANGLHIYNTDNLRDEFYNGTVWGPVSAGGSGSPAGSNTQVQFNNSGSFGADPNFTFDSGTGILTAPKLHEITEVLGKSDGSNLAISVSGGGVLQLTSSVSGGTISISADAEISVASATADVHLIGTSVILDNGTVQATYTGDLALPGNIDMQSETGSAYIQINGTPAPAVSDGGKGRIYFDVNTNHFYVSEDSGAYVPMLGGGGVTYPLTAPDGAVSAPSYSFSSDQQTGWYWNPTTSSANLALQGQDWIVSQRAGDSAMFFAATSVHMQQDLTLEQGDLSTPNGGVNLTFFRLGETLPITPVASSIAQIDSTVRGFLPPRMTTVQKNAIASPAAGLMVFDITLHKLCVFSGTAWETITSA